jgi:signal transduction histidine kinase
MQKKILFATVMSVIVILLSLGVISNISIHESIKQSFAERSELAGMLAHYMDYLLRDNLTRLYDISISGAIDLHDNDREPEVKALQTAYQYSVFTDGIFLLDLKGNVVLTYPQGNMKKRNLMHVSYIERTLKENRSVISNIYTEEGTQRKLIFVLVPLKDKDGHTIGAVGGEIDPTNYILNNIIKAIPSNSDTVIELVDSNGVVIASNSPGRIFACSDRKGSGVLGKLIATRQKAIMKCHRCHDGNGESSNPGDGRTTDMLAFAPLTEAPWGIAVREPEDKVFAPSSNLKKKFLILGFISVGTALVLALGMSKSIVNPIKLLISATDRIAAGNLREPVTVASRDEISILSKSFDTMRRNLSDSLDKIQKYNAELETRVIERTRELQQSQKRLAILLQKIIRAQEEERRRIARELHDETSQAIAALGMSLEIAAIAYREGALSPENINECSGKVSQMLEGISRIIQDLRPPVLDDLGLESAVRWLLERHFGEKGINYQLHSSEEFLNLITNGETVLDDKAMLALFRIIQETIINIYKHARASKVCVSLLYEDSLVKVTVIDDGSGFDVHEVFRDGDMGLNTGYGILGLRERVSLLEGDLDIHSKPGEGTCVNIEIPLSSLEVHDV